MTSTLRGDVPVTVGDRDLVLNFSVDAVIQLEELLDMPAQDIGARIFTDRTQRFKRRFFWSALLERHSVDGRPEFSERQAGELMLEPGSAGLLDRLFAAWAIAWPISPPKSEEANAEASPPTPPAKTAGGDGTGKASSAPGSTSRSGRRKASGG